MLFVVADIDRKDSFQVPTVDDQEPIETLAADGADPPFGERVRARRAYGCADRPDAVGAEDLVKRRRELAVAVTDQKPNRLRPIDKRLDDVARLLGHPVTRRVRSDARQIDLSGCEFDEHECVQPPNSTVSTVKKSQATIPLAWARRNSLHVSDDRRGTGSMPACRKIDQTVLAAIRIPSPASSPWIRR